MDGSNLRIPNTVLFHKKAEVPTAVQLVSQWAPQWLYVRANFSDSVYPHCLKRLTSTQDIEETIHILIAEAEDLGIHDYDMTVQPLLEFDWSGGILVKDRHILLEIVEGAPDALFRKGFFKNRFLLDSNGDLISEDFGRQPVCVRWDGAQWMEYPASSSKCPSLDSLRVLENIDPDHDCLYEVGFQAGRMYFLEYKDIDKLAYQGLSGGRLEKPFMVSPHSQGCATKLISNPLFDHISSMGNNDSVIIKEGAYLSHLAWFMAHTGVGCVFEN
ncbi:hypothetical protein [Geotalea daltonii]|uniref:hypothetical protein n=1 Tax=Geotalea daltonii TaxID=1203471 RepID=UPI0012B5A2E0|nr:hypothetical protein [Geotalea daltonii]